MLRRAESQRFKQASRQPSSTSGFATESLHWIDGVEPVQREVSTWKPQHCAYLVVVMSRIKRTWQHNSAAHFEQI